MEIVAAVKIGGAKCEQMKWKINTKKKKNINPFKSEPQNSVMCDSNDKAYCALFAILIKFLNSLCVLILFCFLFSLRPITCYLLSIHMNRIKMRLNDRRTKNNTKIQKIRKKIHCHLPKWIESHSCYKAESDLNSVNEQVHRNHLLVSVEMREKWKKKGSKSIKQTTNNTEHWLGIWMRHKYTIKIFSMLKHCSPFTIHICSLFVRSYVRVQIDVFSSILFRLYCYLIYYLWTFIICCSVYRLPFNRYLNSTYDTWKGSNCVLFVGNCSLLFIFQ